MVVPEFRRSRKSDFFNRIDPYLTFSSITIVVTD